jgi:hypothetical protein
LAEQNRFSPGFVFVIGPFFAFPARQRLPFFEVFSVKQFGFFIPVVFFMVSTEFV